MKPGVYVHIPFCEQRCYYCAFTVAVSPEETYEPYVRRLIREIELSGFKEQPETIFFGGGTPSIIDAALIEGILRALPPCTGEITIETNPGTLSDSKLDLYRDSGVNRISLGVQSFHDEDLRNAGRLHNAEDVFRDIQSLRNHSFENINVDLIAGLPNQRLELGASWFRVLPQPQILDRRALPGFRCQRPLIFRIAQVLERDFHEGIRGDAGLRKASDIRRRNVDARHAA